MTFIWYSIRIHKTTFFMTRQFAFSFYFSTAEFASSTRFKSKWSMSSFSIMIIHFVFLNISSTSTYIFTEWAWPSIG